MKVLGISGSPRKDGTSGTYKLVKTVVENTGCEYEIVSLRGKKISGCIACLGCAKDNICKLKDDLEPLREKIVEADAFVIGGPNYFDTLNVLTHAFFERWFQFRHQAGSTLWGKLAVAVGVGGTKGKAPADQIEKMCLFNFIETVAKVQGLGAASCYTCGFGETCEVGIQAFHRSQGLKYTDEMPPDVEKQPDVIKAAADAGKLLGHRLSDGHDRTKVTKEVQEKVMALFGQAV
ncbi:NADPH-dependent FMN reductase [Desulfosarcina variabilis str. Montpellier]|uniref:flavodoxin family protein n=1 Tax=Desulfosarcina variabilis TaxID=2300 RepID=UPI003AFA0A35